MTTCETLFDSIDNYVRGGVEVVDDRPRNYAFSKVFKVAAKSTPYRRVAVTGNLGPVFGTTYHHGQFEMFVGTTTEAHRACGREMGLQVMRDYAQAKSV
ncbi:MAG: hypothetical protein AAGG65_18955 [Pseudomonadota bacterium]